MDSDFVQSEGPCLSSGPPLCGEMRNDESMMATGTDMQTQRGCRLWIDGVGCWLVWFRDELRVGNAASGTTKTHLSVQADLRTRHATFVRQGEDYRLVPHGAVQVNGNRIDRETLLRNNDELTLGEDVVWRFSFPSPLSPSAVLAFESTHRPVPRLDGVVLFKSTCLLGPGRQAHVPCPEWEDERVLFVRDGGLWIKAGDRGQGTGGGGDEPIPVADGDVLEGDDGRFRVEMINVFREA